MITRAEAREGPRYQTSYKTADGQRTEQRFFTKDENDHFAKGLAFMEIDERWIIKSFYNPTMRSWHAYSNDAPDGSNIKGNP